MRILIISNTPWNDSNSFGSSFSNIFGGNPDYTIANVCCMPGTPDTEVCSRFFQITERGIINSIRRKGTSSGKEIFIDKNKNDRESTLVKKAKILRWQIFFWGRDMIWATGKWRSKELDGFVKDFNPDLIVLPIYYSTYLNSIGSYIKNLTGKPVVGYISDDCYTMKQFSLSPFFWIDRFIKRRYVRKGIDICETLYTITETQKREYGEIFGDKCKVLFKGGEFSDFSHRKTTLNSPLKYIYTGNIGSGRWKTLALIGDAIAKTGNNAELVIYSQTPLSESDMKRLLRSGSVKFMGGIPPSEVKGVQRDADVLVHVESFELSERYKARLSFSTKVVDYLEAGRCILAVGWEKTGAIEYLSEHDAAYVITDRKEIDDRIAELSGNHEKIIEYGSKGFRTGKLYHQIDEIRGGLYKTLSEVIEK